MWENWRRPGWEQKEEKTEYDVYRLSVREILWGLCKSAAVTGAFAYLFYRSWAGCLAWPVTAVLCLKGDRKRKQKQRKERLSAQFCDAIQAAASGMQAGYSVENAFLEAEREIRALHGDGCEMAEELAAVGKGLKNGIPLEEMLIGLGGRSGGGGGLEALERVLEKCPETNFIGHAQAFWAGISKEGALPGESYPTGKVIPGGKIPELLYKYGNLYCDLSANSGLNALRRDREFARNFLLEFQDRCLFARDKFGNELQSFLMGLDLPETALSKILGGNAIGLLHG